ncbi:hypothetical protein HETIRDRAFT_427309 [Heterobasidion irregulare TC 32-1]|uniref:Uncharacterized protein n=1 Tax=Heterobasidion irregulare (strain TC 32-1) TaxID=747525 RepID=W4KAV0_HETIT|nr:uncharacterized protein HETIRDRAFT_427309 [Heterobasidion irregulare TC 32-1]ETW82201.1 hypothetical protein HETIRDRAFT_427309 [Heterobasidion irregulare TC 32-1]
MSTPENTTETSFSTFVHGQQGDDVSSVTPSQTSNVEQGVEHHDIFMPTMGPAIRTPPIVRDIVVTKYSVQWLNLSLPEQGFYAKNHMVAALDSAQPWTIDGITYYNSARISMELGVEMQSADVIGQEDWVSGENYFPGEYAVRLFKTDELFDLVVYHLTYNDRTGATIGDFIDEVLERDMHHFLFLPYTASGHWKGCGDHIIHTFAVFVDEGLLPTTDSNEHPTVPLSTELTYTYFAGGKNTWCRMGRGWWLKYNPPTDPLTPETSFSEGRLTWQLPTAPQSVQQDTQEEVGEGEPSVKSDNDEDA